MLRSFRCCLIVPLFLASCQGCSISTLIPANLLSLNQASLLRSSSVWANHLSLSQAMRLARNGQGSAGIRFLFWLLLCLLLL